MEPKTDERPDVLAALRDVEIEARRWHDALRAGTFGKPWEHAYVAGADNICRICGAVGSYVHTDPALLEQTR